MTGRSKTWPYVRWPVSNCHADHYSFKIPGQARVRQTWSTRESAAAAGFATHPDAHELILPYWGYRDGEQVRESWGVVHADWKRFVASDEGAPWRDGPRDEDDLKCI